MPIALTLWAIGALAALATGFTTLRYWEGCAANEAFGGATPANGVVFLTVALIRVLSSELRTIRNFVHLIL